MQLSRSKRDFRMRSSEPGKGPGGDVAGRISAVRPGKRLISKLRVWALAAILLAAAGWLAFQFLVALVTLD
jgi:hypothetical protein